jgi:hypothetical protein
LRVVDHFEDILSQKIALQRDFWSLRSEYLNPSFRATHRAFERPPRFRATSFAFKRSFFAFVRIFFELQVRLRSLVTAIMATEAKFDLNIVQLKGEENIGEWKASVNWILSYQDLEEYIEKEIQPTEILTVRQIKKNKIKCMTQLTASIKQVRQRLINAGWNESALDPKGLYETVLRVVPSTSAESIGDLVREFAQINPEHYKTLDDFLTRIQWLRRRLEDLDVSFGEKASLWLVVLGLENYPWQPFLKEKLKDGNLTWAQLLDELNRYAIAEKSTARLAAISTTVRRPSSETGKRTAPLLSERQKETAKKNKGKPGYDANGCHEACGRPHQGGNDRCFKLHPELRTRGGGSTSPRSSGSQPSSGAVNVTSTMGNFLDQDRGSVQLMTVPVSHIQASVEAGYLSKDSLVDDSGCAIHTFNDVKWFSDLRKLQQPRRYKVGNSGIVTTKYWGPVKVELERSDGSYATVTFEAVYSPETPCNLISNGQLAKDGIVVDGRTNRLVLRDGREVAQRQWIDQVAVVKAKMKPLLVAPLVRRVILPRVSYDLMHRRFMHAGRDVTIEACRKAGIYINRNDLANYHCKACHQSKAEEQIHRHSEKIYSHALEFLRIDVIEHKPVGFAGYAYTLHMIDLYSGYHWCDHAKSKAEIFEIFKNRVTKLELQSGRKIQNIGMDGGTELGQPSRLWMANRIKEFLTSRGINYIVTTPHSPWLNARAERAGKEITKMARTALIAANLPEEMWPFAEEAAVHLLNQLPTKSNPNFEAPHERFSKSIGLSEADCKPRIQHLRTLGCRAYVYRKKEYRVKSEKMAPRADLGYLLGYVDRKGKIFWVYLPDQKKVVRVSAVKFDESFNANSEEFREVDHIAEIDDPSVEELIEETTRVYGIHREEVSTAPAPIEQEPHQEERVLQLPPSNETPREPTRPVEEPAPALLPTPDPEWRDRPDIPHTATEPEMDIEEEEAPVEAPEEQQNRYGLREKKDYKAMSGVRPRRAATTAQLAYLHLDQPFENHPQPPTISLMGVQAILAQLKNVPKNYWSARKLPDFATKWWPAMKNQYSSLIDKKVWVLIDAPEGTKVLPGNWVFDERELPNGETEPRARWVVCGNHQDGDWEVGDHYAAVVHSTSVKVFLAIVAVQDLECQQYDFKVAFLNADLPENTDIYVEQPHGFCGEEGKVCRVLKALYGLRMSPLWWFETITPILRKLGFTAFNADLCMFRNEKTGALVILYVDDMLVAAPTMAEIHNIRDQIRVHFELKDLGEARKFLGFTIYRDRENHRIYLSQEDYARAMIKRFDWEDLNAVATPWPSGFNLPKEWSRDQNPTGKTEYLSKTGSLNWYSMGTRPDITYTVNRLAEANSGASEEHCQLMKHLARYITGTVKFAITFGGHLPIDRLGLYCYADAAFADDLRTRYSTGGYVVFLAGGPVFWKSKKQGLVVTSSTEAEFCNLTPATKALQWIAGLLKEHQMDQGKALLLFTDSKNARYAVLNPLNTARTRAIDVRYKYVVDVAKRGDIEVIHVAGEDMVADGLTKPLEKVKQANFVRLLGLTEIPVKI